MQEVVWLDEFRCFAFLLTRYAYQSIVSIQVGTNEWEQVLVDNDDYDLWEERAIEYESDNGSEVRRMPEE